MTKKLLGLLTIAVVIGLSGCGEKKTVMELENSIQNEINTKESPVMDIEASKEKENQNTVEPSDASEKEEYQLSFDVQSEEDLVQMLVGSWEYFDPGFNSAKTTSRIKINFVEDGTFNGIETLAQERDSLNFTGTWTIDRLFRQDDELQDYLSLRLDISENPEYEEGSSFGEYIFDNFGILEGRYVMGLRRVGPEGTLFRDYANPILFKDSEDEIASPVIAPSKAITSKGNLWKVTKEGNQTAFWICDFSKAQSKINVLTKYYGKTDEASEYPFYTFEDGFYPITFTTDKEGYLIDLNRRYDALDQSVEEYYANSQINSRISSYIVKKYDYSLEGPNKTKIIAYFERPIFGGKDKVVKALNQDIDDILQKYYISIKDGQLEEMLEESIDYAENGMVLQYSPHNLEFVHYNQDAVSVAFAIKWFMGGVYNQNYIAINRNLKTGEDLTIEQVMDMSLPAIKDCIADKLEAEYAYPWDLARAGLDSVDSLPFWFDETYVYVGIGSYDISQGTSFFVVKMEY